MKLWIYCSWNFVSDVITVSFFFIDTLCRWYARMSNACSMWLVFMKACIGHRTTGAAAVQHRARVSARCSWTNYRWCIDDVNMRLPTLDRRCIIEKLSRNKLLPFRKIGWIILGDSPYIPSQMIYSFPNLSRLLLRKNSIRQNYSI